MIRKYLQYKGNHENEIKEVKNDLIVRKLRRCWKRVVRRKTEKKININ